MNKNLLEQDMMNLEVEINKTLELLSNNDIQSLKYIPSLEYLKRKLERLKELYRYV